MPSPEKPTASAVGQVTPTETLFDWADKREKDLRDVEARIVYWEKNAETPRQIELLEKFRHARTVMQVGGECPMRRATLYTMLEALAIVGSQFGRPVGPSRETRKSPAELVATFVEGDIPVPAEVQAASRERAREMLAAIHAPLVAAGIAIDGTSQDAWRAKGMT